MLIRMAGIALAFAAIGLAPGERGVGMAETKGAHRGDQLVAVDDKVAQVPQARNRPPVVRPIGNRRVQEGGSFTLRPLDFVSDPDGDRFSVTVLENVGWLSYSQRILSGRPDAFDAPALVRVRARDRHGALSVERSFRVSITRLKPDDVAQESGIVPNDDGSIGLFIPGISANGRFVAQVFQEFTDAQGITTEGINIRDMASGEIWTVFDGAASSQQVSSPAISADGRIVAFAEIAGQAEVRVVEIADADPLRVDVLRVIPFDFDSAQTNIRNIVVSASANGRVVAYEDGEDIAVVKIDGGSPFFIDNARNPSLSGNGLRIAYEQAIDLADGDIVVATVDLARRSVGNSVIVAPGRNPFISSQGNFVAFESEATDLLPCDPSDPVTCDTNATRDIFVYNFRTRAIARASVDRDRHETGVAFFNPSLSANGSRIAFDELSGLGQVLVRNLDRQGRPSGELRNAGFLAGNGVSAQPTLSADGRFVAFMFESFDQVGIFAVFSVPAFSRNAPVVDFPIDPADDINTRARLELGAPRRGEINPASDADWYKVELIGGQSYRFLLQTDVNSGTPLHDPLVEIYDENGTFLDSDDDDGGGPNNLDALLDFPAPSSGTFFIAARDYGGSTGDYLLTGDTLSPAAAVAR